MRSISPFSPGILQLKSTRGTTDPLVSRMHIVKASPLSASAASDGFGGSFADANGPKHAWRRGGFVLTIAYDLWVPSLAGSLRNGCRMCLEQLDVTIQIVHHLGVPAGSAMARHHRSAIWICMVKATYIESWFPFGDAHHVRHAGTQCSNRRPGR